MRIAKDYESQGHKFRISNVDEIVKLILPGQKGRMVGRIKGTRFITVRKPLSHTHLLTNSYGFNYHFINDAEYWGFDIVELKERRKLIAKLTPKEIMEKGEIKQYRDKGFELQIFVSLDDLKSKPKKKKGEFKIETKYPPQQRLKL